jgi:hypothetical protein
MMDPKIMVARTAALVEAGVDNSLFALGINGDHCFAFNRTATEIWRALETPKSLAQICGILAEANNVDPETILSDIAELLQPLADEKLVTLSAS